MAKKAELEADNRSYNQLLASARAAIRGGEYRRAVELALQSYRYVDGMMQYRRRHTNAELKTVESLEIVLRYAPPLLDFESLRAVESLLQEQRRIERHTSNNLGERLAEAQALMWDAHRLWDHLHCNPNATQEHLSKLFGGDQGRWRALAKVWEEMGLVTRTPLGRSYTLKLTSVLATMVPAKCGSCGAVTHAPMGMFLEDATCSHCKWVGSFVIIADSPAPAA